MKTAALRLAGLLFLVAATCAAAAQPVRPVAAGRPPLTIVNFGGANGRAQEVAIIQPFARLTGDEVAVVEYSGELAPIRRMVAAGSLSWDVVEVESTDLALGCKAGLFEVIDRSEIRHAGLLIPGTLQDCGVGAFVWSTVLAYDRDRLKTPPKNWADFWDIKRFPGKRALRKGARYNLEIALMADGVPRHEVYALLATEAGQARALAKLQALLPHLVWWEKGDEPRQLLSVGAVTMSSAFNGRIGVASRAGEPLEVAWTDAIYEFDFWAVVKGSPRRARALAFINHATSSAVQLAFAREIPYGPIHVEAILSDQSDRTAMPRNEHGLRNALIDLSMSVNERPSAPANMRRSLAFSAGFWILRGAELERRLAELLK